MTSAADEGGDLTILREGGVEEWMEFSARPANWLSHFAPILYNFATCIGVP